jgi:hypothetical protein
MILLTEDNPGDVRLLQEALGETQLLEPLQVVGTGEEALLGSSHSQVFAVNPTACFALARNIYSYFTKRRGSNYVGRGSS